MAGDVLTGAEMVAIPVADRVYTCQQCDKFGDDGNEFRMISFLSIGFVICLDCILGDEMADRALAGKESDRAHD